MKIVDAYDYILLFTLYTKLLTYICFCTFSSVLCMLIFTHVLNYTSQEDRDTGKKTGHI
jgi:hypothetical protein